MDDTAATTVPEKPGYWAVLPANVRYDDRLRPNGKILYAEITALASKDGYCWADNKYFADLYGVTVRSIQILLQQLEKLGYVRLETIQGGNPHQQGQRRIWIDKSIFDAIHTRTKIRGNTSTGEQKIRTGEQKIQTTSNNNKKEYNTCTICVSDGDFKPERFEGFWRYYKSVTPKGVSVGGKSRALKAWNKIRPDNETIAAMGRGLKLQSTTAEWQRGIGIPNASTWLNQRRWEDTPEYGDGLEHPSAEIGVQQW